MNRRKDVTDRFLDDYLFWVKTNRKIAEKIEQMMRKLMAEALLNFRKSEKLKWFPNGYSMRIDKKNRLIYEKTEDYIKFISCRGHYEDR